MNQMISGNFNLFVKMFLILFISVSLPVTILGILSYNKSSQQLDNVMSSLIMENVKNNHNNLERLFKDVETFSESIIGSGKLEVFTNNAANFRQEEAYAFIRKAISITNEIQGPYELSIFPASAPQFKVLSQLVFPPESNQIEVNIVRAIDLEGRGFWYSDSKFNIEYFRLIRDTTHLRHLAVIQVKVSNEALQQQLITPEQYANMQHYIIDHHDKNIVFASSSKYQQQLDGMMDEICSFGQQRKVGNIDNMIVASTPIQSTDNWTLVSVIPESDLHGPVQDIKKFSFIIVVISLVVISFFLGLITNSFVKPIHTLVKLMMKVHVGTLALTHNYIRRSDEIGELARGYNSMVSGMKGLIKTTKQVESEKSKMEMQMLIHQINPHFLYNTLESIKWRAEHVEEKTIGEMVTLLSNLLRYSINNGEEFTTVEREIEHVKSYLKIELLRNNESFQVVFHVDERIQNMPILKLIIQPLAENAVKHGMNKLNTRKGKILILLYIDGGELVCVVQDNGEGCVDLNSSRKDDSSGISGIGLYNVNHRLKTRFGTNYGVELTNIGSQEGCKAILRHPIL